VAGRLKLILGNMVETGASGWATVPVGGDGATGPTSLGFFGFSFFLTMWVFAQFLPVLALWQAWSGKFALLALLLAYVAFRRLRPANRWPWIQAVTANFVHAYPYFKRQQLVLDVDEMYVYPPWNSNITQQHTAIRLVILHSFSTVHIGIVSSRKVAPGTLCHAVIQRYLVAKWLTVSRESLPTYRTKQTIAS
jgi:hypothetical protein